MSELLAPPGRIIPLFDVPASNHEVRLHLADAWSRVCASGQFVGGPEVEQFEDAWTAHCGRRFVVGVGNGTDALTLTLLALGIGSGDEVVLPTNTFVATAEAVALVGATPRFVDVEPDTLLVSVDEVRGALTDRTAAVIAVDLFGSIPDMDALADLTDRAGIALLEDAAQGHGAARQGRPAGSFGVASTFSFYPGKNLGALGDAGAVATDDRWLASRIRSLGNHGRVGEQLHLHAVAGTNSRLDALQAAVLSAKLVRLRAWTRHRQELAECYRDGLRGSPATVVQVPEGVDSAHHLFVVQMDDRDGVRRRLGARGIATGVHYRVPCHRTGAMQRDAVDPLPVAEEAAGRILSLPMYPQLSEADVSRVCEAVAEHTLEVRA